MSTPTHTIGGGKEEDQTSLSLNYNNNNYIIITITLANFNLVFNTLCNNCVIGVSLFPSMV